MRHVNDVAVHGECQYMNGTVFPFIYKFNFLFLCVAVSRYLSIYSILFFSFPFSSFSDCDLVTDGYSSKSIVSGSISSAYLCSRHDVRWLDHVEQPTVLRLVDGNTPIMKDEELFIALAQQAAFFCVFHQGAKRETRQISRKKKKNKNKQKNLIRSFGRQCVR